MWKEFPATKLSYGFPAALWTDYCAPDYVSTLLNLIVPNNIWAAVVNISAWVVLVRCFFYCSMISALLRSTRVPFFPASKSKNPISSWNNWHFLGDIYSSLGFSRFSTNLICFLWSSSVLLNTCRPLREWTENLPMTFQKQYSWVSEKWPGHCGASLSLPYI